MALNPEKLRKDFPSLSRKFNGKALIYLDNACMTHKPVQVLDAMNDYYNNYPACHGRSVHKLGNIVTEKYGEAREKVRKFINAKSPEEVIFTRNTTEGINLVANCLGLKKGDVVLTTEIEHNSNLLPWQVLSEKTGVKHEVVGLNKDLTFDINAFEEKMKSIGKSVKLVSMVHTSNVSGATIPADKVAKIAHDQGALLMLDGAQSVPHKPVDVRKIGCDLLAFSSHKMCGPTGVGVLYGKKELLERMPQFLVGGETVKDSTYATREVAGLPDKFEAGLQNYAGGIGAGAAAEYLSKIIADIAGHEAPLNAIITRGLKDVPGLHIIGPEDPALRPGIFNFHADGIDSHDIAMMLDESANIMVRSGAHCVHSWYNAHSVPASVRASLYFYNTKEEAEKFVEEVRNAVSFLK